MIFFRKILRFLNQLNSKNVCVCGHSVEEHHGCCVMHDYGSLHLYRDMIYLECETGYFEGVAINDNPCDCSIYWDKGWFFMSNEIKIIKKLEKE